MKTDHALLLLCANLDVSPSGYYDWLKRRTTPGLRARQNQALAKQIGLFVRVGDQIVKALEAVLQPNEFEHVVANGAPILAGGKEGGWKLLGEIPVSRKDCAIG